MVLRYLARYVFRMAISNPPLMAMDDTHLTFRYQVRDTGLWNTERVEGVEFLRRFLLHVLPKGFHKVRYYGLCHPAKHQQQARARLLLELALPVAEGAPVLRLGDLAEKAHGYPRSNVPSAAPSTYTPLIELRRGSTAMVS